MPRITAFYAGLSALLLVVLAARVAVQRLRARVGVGHGGDPVLARRARAHGNAAEYLPIALLLLLVLELLAIAPRWLHVFGAWLLIARLLHAYGLSTTEGRSFGRMTGILGTWAVMVAMAIVLLWQSIV